MNGVLCFVNLTFDSSTFTIIFSSVSRHRIQHRRPLVAWQRFGVVGNDAVDDFRPQCCGAQSVRQCGHERIVRGWPSGGNQSGCVSIFPSSDPWFTFFFKNSDPPFFLLIHSYDFFPKKSYRFSAVERQKRNFLLHFRRLQYSFTYSAK